MKYVLETLIVILYGFVVALPFAAATPEMPVFGLAAAAALTTGVVWLCLGAWRPKVAFLRAVVIGAYIGLLLHPVYGVGFGLYEYWAGLDAVEISEAIGNGFEAGLIQMVFGAIISLPAAIAAAIFYAQLLRPLVFKP